VQQRRSVSRSHVDTAALTTASPRQLLISALVSALEEAIGILANEVQGCKSDEHRTVLLQARLVLHSAAADCNESGRRCPDFQKALQRTNCER
jgi:hypothetical protein